MTDQEKINVLAKFMGWYRVKARSNGNEVQYIWATENRDQDKHWDFIAEIDWNPLTNWNHWRQIEEKMLMDGEFYPSFLRELEKEMNINGVDVWKYWQVDLLTRCDALLSILNPK